MKPASTRRSIRSTSATCWSATSTEPPTPHDFVQLSISAGITTVKVDADGLVGGSKFTDLCTVAFEDPSTASLDTLIADGNIVLT